MKHKEKKQKGDGSNFSRIIGDNGSILR